jgi:hypothetical protein
MLIPIMPPTVYHVLSSLRTRPMLLLLENKNKKWLGTLAFQ